jgi:hypothetical protein
MDMRAISKVPMAWHAAPAGLFKFRPYRDEWLTWVDAIVNRGEVRFSALGDFDDPFEGRPYAEAVHEDVDKQIYVMRRAHVRAQMELQGVDRKTAEKGAAAINAQTWKDLVVKVQRKMREDLTRNCFVLSLSATREHPMQWSLYADMHRGVCVHFNTQIDPISVAMEVTYSEQYARLPVPRRGYQTGEQLLEQCALVKATWWAYQREFRLLRQSVPEHQWTDLGVNWNGQNALLPVSAVNGITLGARIGRNEQARLVELCAGREPPIPVFAAELAEREFALTFRQIA